MPPGRSINFVNFRPEETAAGAHRLKGETIPSKEPLYG